ncbi:MAG: BamA/TamA family outer membrane protein [Dysgonamonadaceae bacterium]|nr:BamA/TamA family outer membrane protein [Dysgonamonadaceae bacterium]MDD4727862.1 BamA/TamA family outer membrane protein [Dysgonamonadaceae bacterium]
MRKYIICLLSFLFLIACDATKRVPEGSYLLNKVKIDTDTKSVKKSELNPFLRQTPNSSIPIIGKYRLHLYNMAPNDSTWLNRQLRKLGERPVLYSERLTAISAEQIRLELSNRGYLNATVDTTLIFKDKKADVTYDVVGHTPYRILNFQDTIQDTTIYKILANDKELNLIKEDAIFDLKVLEEERIDMARQLRNRGYYNFSKDNFFFLADTTVGTNQVDLTLGLTNPTDTTLHQQYYIGNSTVLNGIDLSKLEDSTALHNFDTIQFRNLTIIQDKKEFLRPRAIYYNTFLRKNRMYAERIVDRTYSSLNGLGPVSQTNINLYPTVRNDTNYLDARISIAPGNLHWMQFGVDGTNSAGDFGVATNITYEHRNIFKGAERLRIRLNGAYEFISSGGLSDSINLIDQSYYEYGAETFLSIPQLLLPWLLERLKEQTSASTEFSVGVNFQKRPEYLRQFFNLSSKLQWSRMSWRLTNTVEPLDINYVRMPWKSKFFTDQYLSDESNPILRKSYEDQLIARTAYSVSFSNTGARRVPKNPFRIRAGIDLAGLIPRLITALGGSKTDDEGYEEILGIKYAEYVKTDFDFSRTYPFDDKNSIAMHFGVGVAVPYGNSIVLPFEKRYFAGGANSVRGWSTRTLGPGGYQRSDTLRADFVNQTGDIKLDVSIEYRNKLTNLFELATFVDAGNIWTIKDYQGQPNGVFRFDEFYKQIAVAYGLGLRINLNFLLLRLDAGMKAYDPAERNKKFVLFKPNFTDKFAVHFAIGYPF